MNRYDLYKDTEAFPKLKFWESGLEIRGFVEPLVRWDRLYRIDLFDNPVACFAVLRFFSRTKPLFLTVVV
jgi:hypothetical protein